MAERELAFMAGIVLIDACVNLIDIGNGVDETERHGRCAMRQLQKAAPPTPELERDMSASKTPTDAERIALQRQCIVEHMRAENAHEWNAVYDTFIRDERASYDVIPMSAVFSGISGVKDFYAAFDAAFPDFQLRNSAEYDVPGCSIREVTVKATHRGEFCGIAATGRRICFELAAFYNFGDGAEAGHLLNERVYFDLETILRQLRGEAEAPTGVGLIERVQ